MRNLFGAAMERKTQTLTHSNPEKLLHGEVTGATISFAPWKFISKPDMFVCAIAATGTPTVSIVSKNKTGAFWTSATILPTGCDSVDWWAFGTVTEV